MKMLKTAAKASEEYLRLVDYVLEKPDGVLLEYRVVEDTTGVRMDARGKARLRQAILRANREYSVIRNVGYKLAEPNMVMGILSFKLLRIDGAVRRADKSHRVLQGAFFASLAPEEQRGVLFVGAIFGAIRLAAENGKRLYGESREKERGVALPESARLRIPDVS